jgi:hypothetical protein
VTVGSGHASHVDCTSIALPTVGADAIGSPDSPVNFSHDVLDDSREQRVHLLSQPRHRTLFGAHWTLFGAPAAGVPQVVSAELLLLLLDLS